jgi:FlgD Ig-like domain
MTSCFRRWWCLACACATLAAAPLHAQVVDPLLYSLQSPPSEFLWGCFGPCMCPVQFEGPLSGTFSFRESHRDPLFTYYDVLGVSWKFDDAGQVVAVTGSGSYRRGGEVADSEQLSLDLSFGGGEVQHFDSGLRPAGAPFPEISTRVSLHGESCHDSVLVVDAKPGGVANAGDAGRMLLLAAAPNPFKGWTEISFTMPSEGAVNLGIFDITGRRVRWLARGEWFARGPHVRSWDGRFDNGHAAPAGLYIIQIEAPSGRIVKRLARVN